MTDENGNRQSTKARVHACRMCVQSNNRKHWCWVHTAVGSSNQGCVIDGVKWTRAQSTPRTPLRSSIFFRKVSILVAIYGISVLFLLKKDAFEIGLYVLKIGLYSCGITLQSSERHTVPSLISPLSHFKTGLTVLKHRQTLCERAGDTYIHVERQADKRLVWQASWYRHTDGLPKSCLCHC